MFSLTNAPARSPQLRTESQPAAGRAGTGTPTPVSARRRSSEGKPQRNFGTERIAGRCTQLPPPCFLVLSSLRRPSIFRLHPFGTRWRWKVTSS